MHVERGVSWMLAAPDEGLIRQMDDFQVIAERRQVMAMMASLTDHYRAFNQEIQRRDTLQWMLAPR